MTRGERRELGQLIAWSLMLGVCITTLAAGYFGIVP